MNRNYTYDPNYAYKNKSAGMPNLPIEEQLRAKFAGRGLGAVPASAARDARQQPMQGRLQPQKTYVQPRPNGQQAPQSRPQQRMPQPGHAPQQNVRPNGAPQRRPQATAVAPHRPKPIDESRPHVSQAIPLYEVKTGRMPLPTAALISLIVCTLTVLSVVAGAAMVSRASDEVSDLKSEAAALAHTERELSQALDCKNDLRTIERIAVDELGMIGTDLITKKYISFSGIDVIEAYDDAESDSVGLSTLLSAIGINVK